LVKESLEFVTKIGYFPLQIQGIIDMQSIENKMLARIQRKSRGKCFTPKAFLDLWGPEAVRIALHRLVKRGAIRRLTRGLYDFPKQHPTIGFLSPSRDLILSRC
jgi:hypothetical protein